ncbi:16S rRNA (cytosine(1402)-N(4))-methyltransferase RsmH [Sulfurovum sp. bin170]|uniref:16S rRNA (cytosine(1402)-N(4))-methyltransferase RsmH n=1 Tax=Sulfurovum sp. bin170 TaxID=2695268 RepID=UPI0013DEC9CB|nr:16S rRNA (cytosine(1402)-N(4))-methyltransferase RsmH [Sulfurovum sp. bin170]NEW61043.1 16S rRNA (cytosine(1402)-N(4))-methyltransferase RsmH [Sulfurovum sp. bin170]
MNTPHIPVLLDEVLDGFSNIKSGYFVDCTLGYAGHSEAMLKRYSQIEHIGIDRDDEALDFSKDRLSGFVDRSKLYRGTFATTFPKLKESPLVAVLADFGVSSLQLDKKQRGFSFESENLDMRMDPSAELSAYEVVNHYDQERLEYILNHYGEVRSYRKVAGAIVEARSKKTIESAKELSDIVCSVIPRGGKIHPATLTFQGIRIEVNNELGEIEGLLDILETKAKAGELKGAIVSLITFHSLEDRLVKNRYKKWVTACICDSHAMRCTCSKNHDLGKMLKRKPTVASKEELKINARSRSAKLRTFIFKG